jgi:class 3 adenylate cyclase
MRRSGMGELLHERYEPLESVAAGAWGEVSRALDHGRGRTVALLVHRGDEEDELPARSRSLLSLTPHPGLAGVREVFSTGDHLVVVADWVHGVGLDRLLAATGDPGLPLTSVVAWLRQAGDALDHLHGRGLAHGAVRPSSLVLAADGRVILVGLGGPGWAAAPDPAADVYGLAATAQALLTGTWPGAGRAPWEELAQGVALERVLRRGLVADPTRRPRRVGELVERLAACCRDLPTGSVSFLLTDIEGSTAAWEADPGGMAERLAAHDDLLGEVVEAAGGLLLKHKGEGDATFSVFVRPTDAVSAALEAGCRLPGQVGLSVRMALHTGEAELRDGDYFGTTVNRAARLRSLAAGGQIVLSEAVAEAVGDRLPTGAALSDLGTRELKGLSRPERVFALLHPDLPEPSVTGGPTERLAGPGAHPFPLLGTDEIALAGREEELGVLLSAWIQAGAGERRTVLVAGEPGVGKTRLAAEAARRAHQDGALVLYGRCDEDLAVPFQPFAEALRAFLAGSPQPLDPEYLGRYAGDLVRLVPELAERIPGLAAPLAADPETERWRLFEAVGAWLEAAAATGGAVLVVDDLHWAPASTLALLDHLLDGPGPPRLLVIGTYRDTERTAELSALLTQLRYHRSGVERLAVTGLDELAVADLVASAAGRERDEAGLALAGALHRETEGNPFFVRELLRHLEEAGVLGPGQGPVTLNALGLPGGLAEVISRRLEVLSPLAGRVLRRAAVVGRDFDLDILAVLTGADEEAILDALEAAVRARLVEETGVDAWRFTHALARSALYSEWSESRLVRLHRQVAEALEVLRPHDVAALAHHFARGGGEKAVHYATRAGDQALDRLAHEQAVTLYRQALDLLDGDEEGRCDLLIALGDAQRRAGMGGHRETLLEAAWLARRSGAGDKLTRAALASTRGISSVLGEADAERLEMLEAAVLAVPARSAARARLLGQLAAELVYAEDRDRRFALAAEAMALAREVGDPETLADVLATADYAIQVPSTLVQRRGISAELAVLHRTAGTPHSRAIAAFGRSITALEAADLAGADEALAAGWRFAAEFAQPTLRWISTAFRSCRALLAGRLAEAEALATEGFMLGQEAGQPDAAAWMAALLWVVRREQGRLEELVPSVEAEVATRPALPTWRLALALAYCEVGRPEDARALYEPFARNGFEDLPYDLVWMPGMCLGAEIGACLGDGAGAGAIYERILPFRAQVVAAGPSFFGSVEHYLGLLAATAGRLDDADRHFAAAAAVHQSLQAPVFLTRTRLCWGEALLKGGRRDDVPRARGLLEEAMAAARHLGLTVVERRADAALDRVPAWEDVSTR